MEHGPPGEVSVGTLNVWGRWADWPRRLEVLQQTFPVAGPDVLMLQEVRHDALGDQAQEIADALGYPHCLTVEGHRADDGSEGLAMLARVELFDVHTEDLPASDPSRRALVARVRLAHTTVTLMCAHTVAVPEAERRAQVEALLARPEDPLILGADLNDVPQSLAGAFDLAGLRDVLAEDDTPTWPTDEATFGAAWQTQLKEVPHFSLQARRLDYLLTRGVEVLHTEIDPLALGDEHASDHALVWGRFVA
jgi:endonuclease/exonuclease/phosphatase family metal-dependent hydrolase